MNDTPPWRSDMYVLLFHPSEPRVLLLVTDSGAALPHARVDEELWSADATRVAGAMRIALSADMIVLRCVHFVEDREKRYIRGIFVLESRDRHWQPPALGDAHWMNRTDLTQLTFVPHKLRKVVETCLLELETGVMPKHRAPWAFAGWFDEAASWIEDRLTQLGYTLIGPVEQVKTWSISCILRATTNAGHVYFKVSVRSPLFVNEAAVMQGLAELFPNNIPAPLCIEREQGWMLLADFGHEIGWDAPVDVREDVLCIYGRMQIAASQRIDDLFAIGCLDRRLPRLAEQIEALLSDDEALAGLDRAEVEQLRALLPRCQAMCHELGSYAVPHSLIHGDLHMSNVARRDGEGDGRYLFFDWSDACVAHPFLDMIDILHEKNAETQARLRESYLALWTDYEPIEHLHKMWKLAEPLCALHQAVSYQHLLANVEPVARRELDWSLPYWLRKALKAMS